MARLANVGYRIERAASPLCFSTAAGTGISLDYIEAYAKNDREAVALLLGMSEAPQIAAVAAGSPAERTGVQAGDDVLAINGTATADLLAASGNTILFADALENFLTARLPDTPIVMRLRRDGKERTVSILPESVCAARVVLKTNDGVTAYTDGSDIGVSSKLIEFTQNDDELALIVAHETSHIISRDGEAQSLEERRRMEDRADILGTRLTLCAGYNIDLASQYWLRRDAEDWLRWFRDPTHRSGKARAKRMLAEAQASGPCPPSVQISDAD